jgi:hypothetical protein
VGINTKLNTITGIYENYGMLACAPGYCIFGVNRIDRVCKMMDPSSPRTVGKEIQTHFCLSPNNPLNLGALECALGYCVFGLNEKGMCITLVNFPGSIF